MPVEVQLASVSQSLPAETDILRWADAALDELAEEAEPPDLCIRVVDDAESRSLNARYRGKDKPTNVLSFPADVDIPGERVLGDLVICAPVVMSEAAAQGKTVHDHFAHMVVHGVLHLTGRDHEDPKAATCMEALEVQILSKIGVGNPYSLP